MTAAAAPSLHLSLLRRPWVGPAAAAVLILAAGGWGLVRPQWVRWQGIDAAQAEAATQAQQLSDYEHKLAGVVDEYQTIRRDAVSSVSRLDTLVPSRIDNARLFAEYQQLVEQTGLTLVNVRIAPDLKAGKPRATTLMLSVAGGNYPALKRLLDVLEHDLRLTDIVNLNFDAQVQTYTISARVYSFE
jgi:hypothetical protein